MCFMCDFNDDNFEKYDEYFDGELKYKNTIYKNIYWDLFYETSGKSFYIMDEIGFAIDVKYCPYCGKELIPLKEEEKESSFQYRGFNAAKRFLESRDYEIIESDINKYVNIYSLDVDGELHFCHLNHIISKDENPFKFFNDNDDIDKELFEKDILCYLKNNDFNISNILHIHFDVIDIVQTDEEHALLRYHTDIQNSFLRS